MRTYACIDLKSFYASVECVERNLNPLKTNLVVADKSRTQKTICLAVSPSLKSFGLPGRCRLFEVISTVNKINNERNKNNNYKKFTSKSYDIDKLKDKNVELDYIVAPPRMAKYIEYSTKIYDIYLKYLAKEDIYVYSIDEIFCDITDYLKLYNLTSEQLITKILKDVYDETGITATAGIGTNLFLAKVAMDIEAKHKQPNEFGVRIANLNEQEYRKTIWNHKPITDVWRIGKGIAKKLENYNIYTMGDLARYSITNKHKLYKLFGVNAELLIDHAFGYEPCTLDIIKKYKPLNNSISEGQVLHCAYNYEKTKTIVKEMADLLALNLVKKNLITNQIILNIGYETNDEYIGEYSIDFYGRTIPKASHGSINLKYKTSSSQIIMDNTLRLYEKIVNKNLLIKRLNIAAINLEEYKIIKKVEQLDIFTDYEEFDKKNKQEKVNEENDLTIQKTVLKLKDKFGKNSIIKGLDLLEEATTKDRNKQIGGHHE